MIGRNFKTASESTLSLREITHLNVGYPQQGVDGRFVVRADCRIVDLVLIVGRQSLHIPCQGLLELSRGESLVSLYPYCKYFLYFVDDLQF